MKTESITHEWMNITLSISHLSPTSNGCMQRGK